MKRSKRFIFAGGIVALVLAIVAGIGSLRMSTDLLTVPAGGTVRPFEKRTLRIASFNIHSGIGLDGRQDLGRIADVIRGFDIVGLNEVQGARSAGEDQASELGRRLGVSAVFGASETRWYYEHFGNGLLHRPDLDGYQRIPLTSSAGRGKRSVIQARILMGTTPVQILVTHIDRGADRPQQLEAIRKMFLDLPAPVILMGDMNTQTTDPLIVPLRDAPGVVDGLKQVLGDRDTPGRIDYIFTRGLTWRDGGLKETPASDHPLVWGEVQLPND